MSAPLHPRDNHQLFGHEEIEKKLLQLIQQERLPNAFLITGNKGVGKATLAYRIARYLLSGGASAGDALFGPEDLSISSEHPVASRISAESHTDLLVLEGFVDESKVSQTATIKVDEARKVGEFLALTPAESSWRIVIIDSADDLNVNAANSLLKQLEEPPERAMMLLISHNPGRLLPTIRSRCRQLRLNTPPLEGFNRQLQALGGGISEAEYPLLYMLSHGAAGRALQLSAQNAPASYQKILDILRQGERLALSDLLKFAEQTADRKAAKDWPVWGFLWLTALTRTIRTLNNTLESDVIEGERMLLTQIGERLSLLDWLEQYDAAQQLLSATDGIHLDKKQTIMQLVQATIPTKKAA